MLNKEIIEKYSEIHSKVHKKINMMVDYKRIIDDQYYRIDGIFDIKNGIIEVPANYYQFGDEYYIILEFPIELLWDDCALSEMSDESVEIAKIKEEDKRQKELINKELFIKRDIAELNRLKKMHPNES